MITSQSIFVWLCLMSSMLYNVTHAQESGAQPVEIRYFESFDSKLQVPELPLREIPIPDLQIRLSKKHGYIKAGMLSGGKISWIQAENGDGTINWRSEYLYRSNGNLSSGFTQYTSGFVKRYKFDERGFLIEQISTDKDGKLVLEYQAWYDEKGRLMRTLIKTYDSEGKLASQKEKKY